jgi:hypothetical protein
MIGIVLSVIFPGLGQFYYGKWVRGTIMLLGGVTPAYPLVLVWSVVDAYRLSRQGIQPQYSKREVVAAVVLCLVVVPLCFAGLAVMAGTSIAWWRDSHLNRSATIAQGSEITAALLDYKAEMHRFPDDLGPLIQGRPLRSGWQKDGWGRPYDYRVEDNGKKFRLISAGRDGQFGTGDDLVWEK